MDPYRFKIYMMMCKNWNYEHVFWAFSLIQVTVLYGCPLWLDMIIEYLSLMYYLMNAT